MDEVRLVLIDSEQALTGRIQRWLGDACLASLSAEPETIPELAHAFSRYYREDTSPFARFQTVDELEFQPPDTGRLVIDLPSRVVTCECIYPPFGPNGRTSSSVGFTISLPYYLSDEWLFLNSIKEHVSLRHRRLVERCRRLQFNPRDVLYGAPLIDWILRSLKREDRTDQTVRRLHLQWFTTPRDDLNGQNPRDILADKREQIELDLHTRLLQWTHQEASPPPCIPVDSLGYHLAGFGAYECVVYYDLVRYLLSNAVHDLSHQPQHCRGARLDTEALQAKGYHSQLMFFLEQLKKDWLEQPKLEYGGRIPALLIQVERVRLPVVMHDDDVVSNEHCLICETLRRESGFETALDYWHIDSAHVDSDFRTKWFSVSG